MSKKNSNFFSRDCMVKTLIQLLKTKSLSNITITELTERAGVSRMTYYRNYHSLDDIFSSWIRACTIQSLEKKLEFFVDMTDHLLYDFYLIM